MNDFERKLSQQTFREPPPALRDALFGREEIRAKIIEPARGTWRDWLWPSPVAWGGIAALWILFAALSWEDRPAPGATAFREDASMPVTATLLSSHTPNSLHHALDLAN